MKLHLAVLLLAPLSACSAPEPEPAAHDPVSREVADEVRAYYIHLSARDWEAFATHFHEGAVLSTRWTPPDATEPAVMMSSVADFVAAAPQGPDSQPFFDERPLTVDVLRQGDMAVAWVTYAARFGKPGALREWTGVDAITLIRHDGAWRITSLAWSGEE